jgi:hypothetical protein
VIEAAEVVYWGVLGMFVDATFLTLRDEKSPEGS